MARTLKDYPSVVLNGEDLDGKIDFVQIFGRPGPVHIEIGSGKAAFCSTRLRPSRKSIFSALNSLASSTGMPSTASADGP